jgi:hypothetical protein
MFSDEGLYTNDFFKIVKVLKLLYDSRDKVLIRVAQNIQQFLRT